MVTVDDSRSVAFREQWSPTSVNLFIRCPLRYWFEKIQGWRETAGEARAAGTLVHVVLEGLLALPPGERDIEVARTLFAAAWDALVADAGNRDLDLHEVRLKSGNAMRTYFDLEDPASVVVVDGGLERQVDGTLGGSAIGGAIDRIERGAAGVRITDYKTGSAKPAYCGPYWRQQIIYAALVTDESEMDPVVEVALAFLGPVSRRMVRPVPASAVARAGSDVARATEERTTFSAAARWEARESPLCWYCPFRPVCPVKSDGAPVPGSVASDSRLRDSVKVRRAAFAVADVEDDDQGLEQWPA